MRKKIKVKIVNEMNQKSLNKELFFENLFDIKI